MGQLVARLLGMRTSGLRDLSFEHRSRKHRRLTSILKSNDSALIGTSAPNVFTRAVIAGREQNASRQL